MRQLGIRNGIGITSPVKTKQDIWTALAPSDLAVVINSDTQATLTWINNDTKGDGSELEMSTDGVTYNVIATLALGTATYPKTGLTADTLYYFRIRAYKGSVYSEYSSVVSAATYTYWAARSLFYLDGTIITVGENQYFEDKSSADRHFLITGYDFNSDWTIGFPYKSSATISAPAADAVLIAADFNNFLYSALGVPNQIPVVSLFQNIDYQNKIFCKHEDQVIDGDGVETYEPRVSEIFMTAAALSAEELVIANAYFSVPSETVGAYWVTQSGNDSTGDGSKATPWRTLDKALTTVNDGSTIYAATDDHKGNIAVGYIFNYKNNVLKGIGFDISVSTSTTYGIRFAAANSKYIEHFYIKPVSTSAGFYTANAVNLVIEKFRIDNNAGYFINPSIKQVNNSVITGTCSVAINSATGTEDVIFQGNLFTAVSTSCITLNNDVACSVLYNIFKNNGGICFNGTGGTKAVTISYNTFSCVLATNSIVDAIDRVMTISYNIFNVLANQTLSIINISNKVSTTAKIFNNIFNNQNGCGKTMIYALNQGCDVYNNIFNAETTEITTGAEVNDLMNANAAVAYSGIYQNRIISQRTAGYNIAVGNEGTSAGDNDITEIEINSNYIQGSYGEDSAQTTHAIFVGFQINAKMNHNFVFGGGYGVGIKGSAETIYASGGFNYNILLETQRPVTIKGAQAVVISNNTIINKINPIEWGVSLVANTGSDEPTNCIIKNNIIISLKTGVTQLVINNGVTCAFDYNLYYCPNGTPTWGGLSWVNWQASGQDEHSIILTDEQFNGLFTDFANNDFSLKAGSVAIGNGVSLGAGYTTGLDETTDWGDATTVPAIVTKEQGDSWDIGAYIS